MSDRIESPSLGEGGSDGKAPIETSEIVLDYLPADSERLGGLIFQSDPARYELRLEAKGYVDP